MLTYASKVVIERPPAAVFPYFAELEKQALWSDVPMRRLTEGPFGVGSQIEVSFGMGLMKAKIGLEITELARDRRMAWKTISGPIKWEGEYTFEPMGGGTVVSQRGTLTFTGIWRLVEPMAGAEIQRGEEKELEKLKAVVEASPST
jgi:hypothetical protein